MLIGLLGLIGVFGVPDCLTATGRLEVNNEQVLEWKRSTPNLYGSRARIQGVVSEVLPAESGSLSFIVRLGPGEEDLVEVLYSRAYQPVPEPAVGMTVEACGDYVTLKDRAGPLPPSPAGAVVHWVHANTNPRRKHLDGYLVLDGVLYGTSAFGGVRETQAQ